MRIFVSSFVGMLALMGGVVMRAAVDSPTQAFIANVAESHSAVELASELTDFSVPESATLSAPSPRSNTLLFVGDIMLSRSVGAVMANESDYHYPFLKVADRIRAADIAFGNLEGPISKRGVNQGSKFSFRADPRVAPGLAFAGFDVLSLANNHIFDWGRDALADTLNMLELQKIVPVGAGRNHGEANEPKIIELEDARVAFLAYTTLAPANWKATAVQNGISDVATVKIKEQIAAASLEADIVMVSLHWGEEYEKLPSEAQRMFAHALVDAGADLIIGHHPHVVQEVEQYKDGWIAYSLGNFVFDQDFREETMRGLMLEATVGDGGVHEVHLIPTRINSTFQPEIIAP